MEKLNDLEQKSLIHELNQGRELANQLKNHLGPIPSKETCEHLVQKILSSYDNALAVLNWTALLHDPSPVVGLVESPQSFDGISPKSEGAYAADSKDQTPKDVFKKRKTLPRWSEQVRVYTGTGLEGRLEDGYSWRKYGQKDIQGATYPRAYYRCTHRHTRGCAATKQVQRSDEDPSIIEVTYRGKHSCMQASNSTSTIVSLENEKAKEKKDNLQQQQEQQKQDQGILFNIGQGLKVETEDLDSKEDLFPSFSFPSTPIESANVESQIFWEPLEENTFLGSYSPSFISPATSESNYFSMSPCQMNNYDRDHKWQSSESDLADIMSTPTSVTNSPFDWFSQN